jgi:transcription elongation GreA/GreB family factor
MELTEAEILQTIEKLREDSQFVKSRLELANGQSYYDDLDELAEINTRIKQLQTRLEEKELGY